MQDIAVGAGALVLENGGETYRAEDTIVHVAAALGAARPSAFVTPTVIMFSYVDEAGGHHTYMRRIFRRGTHLNRLSQINALSRRLDLHGREVNPKLLENLLRRIETSACHPRPLVVLAAGCSSLFFTLLFCGSAADALYAFAAGVVLRLLLLALEKTSAGQNGFMLSLLSGACAAATSECGALLPWHIVPATVLMGTIMQVVPGLALVNGIRDIISGDFVSGGARLLDACMIAAGLSVGAVTGMLLFRLVR